MKKLLIGFIAFFAFFTVAKNIAYTQAPSPIQSAYPLNTNSDVPQNFRTYSQNVFIEMLSTATCFVGGVDMLNPDIPCLGMDPTTKKIGYVENQGGLTMVMAGMIGATYNIPVSSGTYVQYLASNFGITQTSFARIPVDEGGTSTTQGFGTGIGYKGLTPVLEIWRTFRNLTYLLFVLIFVVLGLGIMFRVNIDARTVMTIQNQIPKIVIALILITLSYAIAGFLIDMMYVLIYVVIHIFDSQGLTTLTNIDTNPVMAIGPFGGIHGIASPAAQGVGGIISSMFQGTWGSIIGSIVTGLIGSFIGGSFGGLMGGAIGGIIGVAVGALFGSKILGLIATAIAYLIIAIAILSALFRVWFMLIKAYIFIFLDVIFAPFWIVGGILPGAPGGVGPWLRSLIANLAAFPAVIVLFMIGRTIQDQTSNAGGLFVPPLVGDPGNAGDGIGAIIGLGIILIMPEAVTITKQVLKAPEMKYTAAVGRAIGVGQGVVSKPFGSAWHELTKERRDGSRGPLTATAFLMANKIGEKTKIKNAWNKTPIGKLMNKAKEAEKQNVRNRTKPNDDEPGGGGNSQPRQPGTPPHADPNLGGAASPTDEETAPENENAEARATRLAAEAAARASRQAGERAGEAAEAAREASEKASETGNVARETGEAVDDLNKDQGHSS